MPTISNWRFPATPPAKSPASPIWNMWPAWAFAAKVWPASPRFPASPSPAAAPKAATPGASARPTASCTPAVRRHIRWAPPWKWANCFSTRRRGVNFLSLKTPNTPIAPPCSSAWRWPTRTSLFHSNATTKPCFTTPPKACTSAWPRWWAKIFKQPRLKSTAAKASCA